MHRKTSAAAVINTIRVADKAQTILIPGTLRAVPWAGTNNFNLYTGANGTNWGQPALVTIIPLQP